MRCVESQLTFVSRERAVRFLGSRYLMSVVMSLFLHNAA